MVAGEQMCRLVERGKEIFKYATEKKVCGLLVADDEDRCCRKLENQPILIPSPYTSFPVDIAFLPSHPPAT